MILQNNRVQELFIEKHNDNNILIQKKKQLIIGAVKNAVITRVLALGNSTKVRRNLWKSPHRYALSR